MSELMYKTPGNVSPDRMPKVYFCCHPKDFDRFFESISDDIIAKQRENKGKCAIWYNSEPDGVYSEDFLDRLREMNLFVVPVTTEFLTTNNPALEVEYKFAEDNHIPILPLMQESGLEDLFNKKCGDRQFLDKSQRDDTAISYDEKLSKYLSSILIGDELAEKIRKAFDAYVFLSYRKKDRKYAQELMRLIHKNDFCRDIAIWYDEFLVPGEDFNELIKKALEKSKLFVLTVTPGVVEKTTDKDGKEHENYIVEHEYPMARESGKPILPAELEKTDKAVLSEKYDGIPPCINARDDKELERVLSEALADIAVRQNDNDPRHNFFIGLAYLGGIDVEVDHAKAVELIQSAANAGLEEAMEKLVSMYRSSEGIARDYNTAISWQKKLVQKLKDNFASTGNHNDAYPYLSAVWELGDYIYELRDIPGAESVYAGMCDFCKSFISRHGEAPRIKRYLSVSYDKLGNIYKANGDIEAAKEYYEKSLAVREELVQETGTVESRRDLSISYDKLGNIYKAKGDIEAAKEYYEKSLAVAEELAKETGTVESRRDLSISYNRLGDIYEAKGDIEAAKEYYEKSFVVDEELAKETGTVELRRDLSVSYNKLGNIYKAKGDIEAAKEYYEKLLAVAEELAKETGTVESRRDLSVSYERLGDIYEVKGDIEAAKEYYEKSLAVDEELAKETGTVESRRDLSVSCNNLGDIYEAKGDIETAKAYYEKSLAVAEELAKETGTVESRRDLSISCNNLGDIYEAKGDIEAAKEYYEKNLAVAEELDKETGTVESRRDLSISYERLGNIYKAKEDIETAKEYYEKSLAVAEELARETGTVQSKRDLSISCNKLGDIYESKGYIEAAKEYYEKSLAVDEELAKETGTVEAYDDLAVSCYKTSFVCRSDAEKLECLRKAFKIWDALSKQCPGVAEYVRRRGIVEEELKKYEYQS